MNRARVALIDRRAASERSRHPLPSLSNELRRRPDLFEVVLRSTSLHGRLPADPSIDIAVVFVDSGDHDHDRAIDALATDAGRLVVIDGAQSIAGRPGERWPLASAHLSMQASPDTILRVLVNLASQTTEQARLLA
jgi:hypothetical protein